MPRSEQVDPERFAARLSSAARFDSALPSRWSRWSYRFAHPTLELRAECDGQACLRGATGVLQQFADPVAALQWLGDHWRQAVKRSADLNPSPSASDPPFTCGWVGHLAYELGAFLEPAVPRAKNPRAPLFIFTFHPWALAQDAATRAWRLTHPDISTAPPLAVDPLPSAFPDVSPPTPRAVPAPFRSNFTRDAYLSAVRCAIEFIRAGDVFQVNLAQQFSLPLREPPASIYSRLLHGFPASHGALLQYSDFALLSNSPELFLRITPSPAGRAVLTRPIKGTRPRLPGMEEALRASAKDQAELNMIIDLERNDLGRICQIGAVRVTEPRAVEGHPTLFHAAASVEGLLRPETSFLDILRAAFPGGSITGAPKIRAMQIIDELEPDARGAYCGAIGFLSASGHAEFNVAIRTMTIRDGEIRIPAGGGIVADSTPEGEYEETLVKAQAMLAAVQGTSPSAAAAPSFFSPP